jgi:hypothetical protein
LPAALEVLEGLGLLGELQQTADLLLQQFSHLSGCGEEELAARVDVVDAPVLERVVKLVLEGAGVLGEEEGVHVIRERDRGVAKFANPVARLQPAGQPNLDDTRSERADVGDDVHVPARSDAVVVLGNGLVDVGQPLLQVIRGGVVTRARSEASTVT